MSRSQRKSLRDKFGSDVAMNTGAFATIIGVQQVIVMPLLARTAATTDFSHQVLMLTISTVLVNVLGVELANATLARAAEYRRNAWAWDLSIVLLVATIGAGVLGATIPMLFGLTGPDLLGFGLVTAIGISRAYCTGALRLGGRFRTVLFGSFAYLAGAAVGVGAAVITGWLPLPFILGEVSALSWLVASRPFRTFPHRMKPGAGFSKSTRLFLQLASVALIVNTVSYFDRLLAFPLLGAAALAIYYSASVVSKSLGLLTNPISSALLARLAQGTDDAAKATGKRLLKLSPLILAIGSIINIAASFAAVLVLYPHYFAEARPLLIPISIAAALASTSDFLKPVIIRRNMGASYLASNVTYALSFSLGLILLMEPYGLFGFALSAAIGRAVQLALFLWLVSRTTRVRAKKDHLVNQ